MTQHEKNEKVERDFKYLQLNSTAARIEHHKSEITNLKS